MKHLLPILPMILSALFAHSASAEQLNVGDQAPNPAAIDSEGTAVDLTALFADGYSLVYFYPKADTPGCTAQSCSLRDAYQELTEQGVKVFGVSCDTPKAQKKFKDKYTLPFTLLADTDGKVADAFGVPRKMKKFASRQAFLIKDGKIAWLDRKASTKKQAEDVLAVLAES